MTTTHQRAADRLMAALNSADMTEIVSATEAYEKSYTDAMVEYQKNERERAICRTIDLIQGQLNTIRKLDPQLPFGILVTLLKMELDRPKLDHPNG